MKTEAIDIARILVEQNVPKGTKFYSNICGTVAFDHVDPDTQEIIVEDDVWFDKFGRYFPDKGGECVFWPSADDRSWKHYHYQLSREDVTEVINDYCYYNGIPLDKLKGRLMLVTEMMAIQDYVNDGWTPNWKDVYEEKCYFFLDVNSMKIHFNFAQMTPVSLFHFKSITAARKAVEMAKTLDHEIIEPLLL